MRVRRVVTGHAAGGGATVTSDGPAPRAHDLRHLPGMSSTLVWATEPSEPIPAAGEDPTGAVRSYVPDVGASRLIVLRFPPDSELLEADIDPAAAAAEQLEVSPGIAEHFEPDAPGMHTTDTVDYVIVIEGELWLDLDDGAPTRLEPGDIVIQNGTRHAWRNLGDAPATAAFVLVGARRR